MLRFPGYHAKEQLYESRHTLIFRGERLADSTPVIFKMLKKNFPTPEEVVRFRREYEMTRCFQDDGIIQVYDLRKYENTLVMILEDFGGQDLRQILNSQPLPFDFFLKVALRITLILGRIHEQHLMHKDINPANIIWNQNRDIIKLIDFGISTELSNENPEMVNPNVLEGTLAYISPEQTGRMNRNMDYRTDLYSLGILFYEMLTGSVPFQSNDPMELVHCHIAKMPPPPHQLNSDIPESVSEMIMKLMAKTAEKRYQSTFGLKADLESCLEQLQNSGTVQEIQVGQKDISSNFRIPQRLYGRDAEVSLLLDAFDRVSQGRKEIMLVAGYSGIGKSALVHEVHKPITRQRGYFLNGKFDQFKRNIPYDSMIQAFQGLIHQLLTESSEKIENWKTKLLKELGPNGQVIIEVIPEVELIIGPQPPVISLPPAEANNRFNLVFQNFVRTFASREHPLVIFLDDLQWADLPSLKLIELLMSDSQRGYIFIIGAYRDNEVDAAHPLMHSVAALEKSEVRVNTIYLNALKIDDANQLIADTLLSDPETTLPVAQLCLEKTQGNPFFLNQFLDSLYREGLFQFDRTHGCWNWEMQKIQQADMTDNVVDLMVRKIKTLPGETQDVLKLGACIGNHFNLKTLAIVYEKSQKETARDLWNALKEGMIIPRDDAYKFVDRGSWQSTVDEEEDSSNPQRQSSSLNPEYRFLHDRVQQASYLLIEEEHKKEVHLKVGRLILANVSEEERDDRLFDIVNHMNQGLTLLKKPTDREQLARLNLMAGRKAKDSAAYEPALDYLKSGLDLLEPSAWEEQYDLSLELHVEAAEAAYLTTDYDQMESLAAVVLKQTRDVLDKVKIFEIKIQAQMARNQPLKAVQIALNVLKLLGVSFPENPGKWYLLFAIKKTRFILGKRNIEDLINLPDMTDPRQLAIQHIISSVITAAYTAAPTLQLSLILKATQLSIKNGNSAVSAYIYATYGAGLCGVLGDIPAGYQFGELALKILEKFQAKELKARTFFIIYPFIRHWHDHAKNTLKPVLEGYQSGLETGDLEPASYDAMFYSSHSFFMGKPLNELEQEMASYTRAIDHLKQGVALGLQEIYWQTVLNLMGKPGVSTSNSSSEDDLLHESHLTPPNLLVGKAYNEHEKLPMHLEGNDQTALCYLYANKLILSYLFGDYEEALANAKKAKNYLSSSVGMMIFPLVYFYQALARFEVYPQYSEAKKKLLLKKINSSKSKIKDWAHHAPMNYQHKFYLLEAEYLSITGESEKAIDYYDQAIKLAQENEFLNDEALTNELYARYWLARDNVEIARLYMKKAHHSYELWGAKAKVRNLEKKYPHLLIEPNQNSMHLTLGSTIQPTTLSGNHQLDLGSIMKASQTLSGEIVLSQLLNKLMTIVIENAGAQKGVLLLEAEGHWLVEAEGHIDQEEIEMLHSIPIEEKMGSENLTRVPVSLVYYVAKTQEDIVLENAFRQGNFIEDPYIQARRVKSVMCLPIRHQKKISGMLYLENNLIEGAFTEDRLATLQLLSSQTAISLENALLYSQLEKKVEERTKKLQDALKETQAKEQEISHINQVAQTVNATLDLDEVLNAVMHALQPIFRFDQLGILLIDDETNELVFNTFFGSGVPPVKQKQMMHFRYPIRPFISFMVEPVLSSEMVYVGEVTDEVVEKMFPLDQQTYEISNAQAYLFCPLIVQEKVIGTISFGDSKNPFDLDETNLDVIQRYVTQIATAINNAKMYDALKKTKIQLAESEKIAGMTKTFEKFVPKQFLIRIADQGIENIELGIAESDFITLLFSDIRSFTSFSERMEPQQILTLLNEYFQKMNEPIHANYGFIDKFIGDAIMALFDRQEGDSSQEATDAIHAAIGMQVALTEFNRQRSQKGEFSIKIGVGIHSGPVTFGTVGAKDRMDSTVLGDTVNLASRLENLTKIYKSPIIISAHTYRLLDDQHPFFCRELDFVEVKGKEKPVSIFEIFNSDPPEVRDLKQEILKPYHEGLMYFHVQEWQEALNCFQQCLEIFPEDCVSQLYLMRCYQHLNLPHAPEGKAFL